MKTKQILSLATLMALASSANAATVSFSYYNSLNYYLTFDISYNPTGTLVDVADFTDWSVSAYDNTNALLWTDVIMQASAFDTTDPDGWDPFATSKGWDTGGIDIMNAPDRINATLDTTISRLVDFNTGGTFDYASESWYGTTQHITVTGIYQMGGGESRLWDSQANALAWVNRVPEPSSLGATLFAMGLLPYAYRRRRAQKG